VCQPSLFPPGWVVAWRDGGRSGFAAYPDHAAARLSMTCLLMTVSRAGVVRLIQDGEPVVEFSWRTRRRMRLSQAVCHTPGLFDTDAT
jgi:hypothetical protein